MADGVDPTMYAATWSAGDKKTVTLNMPVADTNYYCVRVVNPSMADLHLKTVFENNYGRLPAEFYYSMKTTMWLMITYGVIAATWIYLCHKHAEELLTLQVRHSRFN